MTRAFSSKDHAPVPHPQNEELDEIRSQIDRIKEILAGRDKEKAPSAPPAPSEADPRLLLVNRLAFSLQIRRLRRSHFGSELVSGPAWDMMLDLALAEANGRRLSASDLAAGAEVPLSSGLRVIAALEQLGLAVRSVDERDRRRSVVKLTDVGIERIASFFDKAANAWQANQHLAT